MVIVYESKTGFTKKYADMLAKETGLKSYSTTQLNEIQDGADVIFLGWVSAGKIKGIKKVLNKYNVKAVCANGLAKDPEPNIETLIKINACEGKQVYYLRGGCKPLKEIEGLDKFLLSAFLKMLKGKKDKASEFAETIKDMENGADYVDAKNLAPVVEWVKANS